MVIATNELGRGAVLPAVHGGLLRGGEQLQRRLVRELEAVQALAGHEARCLEAQVAERRQAQPAMESRDRMWQKTSQY